MEHKKNGDSMAHMQSSTSQKDTNGSQKHSEALNKTSELEEAKRAADEFDQLALDTIIIDDELDDQDPSTPQRRQ